MVRLSCLAAGLAAAFVCPSVSAAEFATRVAAVNLGPNANPSFPPANALGGPEGGGLFQGGLDVCVLGVGGSITLGFDVVLRDGPGADFIAFENGFGTATQVFAEVGAVEVSSDGLTFARFPMRYAGPNAPLPAFGTIVMGTYSGMVGGMPVIANVVSGNVPADDPVQAGGEAFDLSDLAGDPAVLGGLIDLQAIRFVRIVDLPAGAVLDANGNPIFDHGGATGSVDFDAVAAVNHSGNVAPGQPTCDLSIDAAGHVNLVLGDSDGFLDLDPATLRASFDLVEFPFGNVLHAFTVVAFDGKTATLRTLAPVTGGSFTGAFAVSVHDRAGGFSGDQVMVQGVVAP